MGLKVVQLNAYSKKEAIELAKSASDIELNVKFDATRSYNDASCSEDFDFVTFLETKLEKTVKSAPGVGGIIVVKQGVPETKTRVHEVQNVITVGTTKYNMYYELTTIHVETGYRITLGVAEGKAEAIKKSKELIPILKQDIEIRKIMLPVVGEKLAAIVKYNPTEGLMEGVYIVFGYSTKAETLEH